MVFGDHGEFQLVLLGIDLCLDSNLLKSLEDSLFNHVWVVCREELSVSAEHLLVVFHGFQWGNMNSAVLGLFFLSGWSRSHSSLFSVVDSLLFFGLLLKSVLFHLRLNGLVSFGELGYDFLL